MILLGTGMGLTTAPATEAILGVVRPEQAGVGSAVNDATRLVGGTLGVAVLGSVYASLYRTKIDHRRGARCRPGRGRRPATAPARPSPPTCPGPGRDLLAHAEQRLPRRPARRLRQSPPPSAPLGAAIVAAYLPAHPAVASTGSPAHRGRNNAVSPAAAA